ncbi:MAG: BrnT family toxin [Bryobacteraceae bacterium]
MEFEWDERKRRLNLEKHGIDFENAIAIWEGFVAQAPSLQKRGEERFLAFGLLEGRVICVVSPAALKG